MNPRFICVCEAGFYDRVDAVEHVEARHPDMTPGEAILDVHTAEPHGL